MDPRAMAAIRTSFGSGFRHRSRVSTPLSQLLVCCIMLFAPAGAVASGGTDAATLADSPIIFSATGDVPYGDSEVSVFQQQIDDHNVYSPSEFFVHLGDILSGSESCSEFRYQRVADIMHILTVPAYIVPGDNETIDCSSSSSGWNLWVKYFMRFENFFCGTPSTARQTSRPENFAFVKNGVLFVGINLVGGNNDTRILQDDATWASQQLTAKKSSVRAAVFFAQAGPGDNHSTFFNPFVTSAASFGKPILYLHGNDHSWQYDHPFSGAPNVLRVIVDRGGKAPPVQVTVTLDNSNTTNAFLFNRDPWKSKTRYERPPCVNAGPDQTVAASATLSGAATDNWVPNNPPRLTYAWSQVSGPGTVTLSAPTALTTTASFSAAGTYVILLTVNDGLQSSSDDVTVTVTSGSNSDPVANNDSYSTNEDVALTVTAPGVLGNDIDSDGDSLIASVASGPSHGSLALQTNGSFTYTPDANYNGSDSFTYTASDGRGGIATAMASLAVNPVNDPPAVANDSYSVVAGSSLVVSAPGVLANDTDPDGDALSAALVASPAHGTLSLASNGSFTYTPAAAFAGQDTFTYSAGDGQLNGNAATVTINVTPSNRSPVAGADAYSTNEDSALAVAAPGVLANDSDPDGDALSAALVASPAHGTLSLASNGSFTYTPAAAFAGQDTFTYSASDGQLNGNTATVTINVTPSNRSPIAGADAYSTNEDAALAVAAPGVLANDTDPDGDPLTATVASGPTHGSLAIQGGGSFTYTPATNFNGTDSFTYTVSDGRGGTATGSVTLTIHPVNDPPTAAGDSYTVTENNTLAVPAPGVLANDADPDGDPLTAALVTGTTHGSLTLNGDGSFTYVPAASFIGTDSFTYRAGDPGGLTSDATATLQIAASAPLTLTFAPAADAYVSSSNPTTNYGTTTDLRVKDTKRSYLRFTVTGVGGTLVSAKLRLYPTNGGPDGGSFYSVSNNYLGTTTPWAETGINWNNSPALNGTPAATAGAVSAGTWRELDVTPSITGDGTYCYGALSSSSDNVSYNSREASSNRPQLVIVVQQGSPSGNTPPLANADSYSVNEDSVLTVGAPGVLGNDTDANGDPLSVSGASSPAHGTLGTAANGGFTYTPAANYNGPDSFTYTASDGRGGTATATVSLTVSPVNDPPVAAPDSWPVTAGQPLTVAAPGVLANDTDVDGDPLSAALVTGAAHGTLMLDASGSFSYTPATGFSGSDTFTYQASDGIARSATATVTLTVGGGSGGGGPVVFEEVQSGGSTGLASVATAGALTGVSGHLYLAAIATKSSGTVTGVSGLGLAWTRVRAQCGGRAQTGVEVWVGSGTPTSGTVSATLQAAAVNAVIMVARYSGADPAGPLGNIVSGNELGMNGACSGGVDNAGFTFDLATSTGNLVFGAVASRAKTLTPGTGYVKRGQVFQGADASSMASASIMDRTAPAGATRVDGTFNSTTDWAVVAVEIRPRAATAQASLGDAISSGAVATRELAPGTLSIYPNPFGTGIWIECAVPSETRAEAAVYSVRGQRVRTLAAGRRQAGTWRLYWDGKNDLGRETDRGIYFLRMRLGDVLSTRKIVRK